MRYKRLLKVLVLAIGLLTTTCIIVNKEHSDLVVSNAVKKNNKLINSSESKPKEISKTLNHVIKWV